MLVTRRLIRVMGVVILAVTIGMMRDLAAGDDPVVGLSREKRVAQAIIGQAQVKARHQQRSQAPHGSEYRANARRRQAASKKASLCGA